MAFLALSLTIVVATALTLVGLTKGCKSVVKHGLSVSLVWTVILMLPQGVGLSILDQYRPEDMNALSAAVWVVGFGLAPTWMAMMLGLTFTWVGKNLLKR